MSDFLALQQFVPKEYTVEKKCIWCQRSSQRNKAHIISRKLTVSSHSDTILRYSVCKKCNERCSEVEKWVLRNTPLSWLRFPFYVESNKASTTNTIPSYFYANDLREWLVYYLEGNRSSRSINSQCILSNKGNLLLITEQNFEEELDKIRHSIRNGDFVIDLKSTLPDDFSPRVVIDGSTIILIAHNQNKLDALIQTIQSSNLLQQSIERLQPIYSGYDRQHFKWSKENWLKFSAKIAYETLCLFEGATRCLSPEFETVRSYVLAGISKTHKELVFDEHGPMSENDVPLPLHVDLSVNQNCPNTLSALLPHVEPGMHSVAIYEIDGWVCSSISISGFPPSFLVLGGPDSHLNDLYLLIYDEEVNEFDFVRLAHDPLKPIIPLYVTGDIRESIARTYKLQPKFME